ncbi:uncharacterized protein LOC119608471 [Lucilia sericata]|uniref:uncharacterized protein LOC119608471 n=1 Tax=Lucilia sericata TaxID=13632 RepID=UPI0018A83873|nr:uncharacterized protein LOC119608471 [Lucilia sericata]
MREIIWSKFLTINSLIILIAFSVITKGQLPAKKTWSYELKSITSETSDTEKLKVHLEIQRISRGVFAISGTVLFNYDVAEGDSNMISAKSYRSAQGDNDYKVLPFQMPATHFFKVLNTHYKDVIMDTLKDCSDFPVFEDKFVPPLEKKLYTLDSCQFSQDGLPNHLQDGFYKLLIIGSGDADWKVEIIAEVTQEL